jgi:hypothetical protein
MEDVKTLRESETGDRHQKLKARVRLARSWRLQIHDNMLVEKQQCLGGV